MKKLLAPLLTLTLLLGVLATSALATDLETVQEGLVTITNVTSTDYFPDGNLYNCEDYTTISFNEDVVGIAICYYEWMSGTWEELSVFDSYTYDDEPVFDTSSLFITDMESNVTYTLLEYVEAVQDGIITEDNVGFYLIPAGSSIDLLAPLEYGIIAGQSYDDYEIYFIAVDDTDGIATAPADETEETVAEEAVTEELAEEVTEEAVAEEAVTEEFAEEVTEETVIEEATEDVAEEVADLTATATSSAVLVDGEEVAFEAYNIADNNYFKLRDVAAILSGSAAEFEVTWDGDLQAIDLITGEAYTEVGGELVTGDGLSKTAISSTATIYLNGEEVTLTAYTINDNNYFKLRDLGEALGFNVSWDNDAQAIVIVSDEAYTAD